MSKQLIDDFVWESGECGHYFTFDSSTVEHAQEFCEIINTGELVNCHECDKGIRYVDPLDLKPGESCIVYLKHRPGSRKGRFAGFVDGRRVKFIGVSGAPWIVDDREISKVEVCRG